MAAMMQSYPGINPEISDWKGQEITNFQEELLTKVNGRLSEKWFYSHLKSANPSLPRIDVLNMLCKYAGYINWDDFRYKNSVALLPPEKTYQSNNIFIKVPLMLLAVIVILFVVYKLTNTQNYIFTFIDADTGEPIENGKIQVDLLLNDESPVNYICDNHGGFKLRTDQSKVKLVIKSPYYHADTIVRILKKFNHSEQIKLRVDDYALMISYFSQTDVEGWQKRREQLNKVFSDNALVYHVPDRQKELPMEVFNKQEFIDKLTMPVSSLEKIEILDSKYENGQIVILRFRVNKIAK
ncbi:MAG: hypothetical protein ACOYOV_15855 [Bacteroidales bacterium]